MKGIILLVLAGPVAGMMIGCSPQASPGSSSRALARDTSIQSASLQNRGDKYLIVNCKYPPRIRTTGGLVMQIPRRPERITLEQCMKKGGEAVSAEDAWLELAKEGDLPAQKNIADEKTKRGVEQACREGDQWYRRALRGSEEAGNSQIRSQVLNERGYLYDTGCGVEKNPQKAKELYEKAVDPHEYIRSVDFGSYHALVIGNNSYQHLSNLNSAINDAKGVKEVLERKYGFKTRLLTDATRVEILRALEDYLRNLGEKDNLLIYYAGHGFLDQATNQGYWQPVDATPDSRALWIKTGDVTDILDEMLPRRVLLVSDSCYSGAFARSITSFADIHPRKVTFWIHRMQKKRTRMVLASGGLEPVLDCDPEDPGCEHSVFAKYFIQTLEDNDQLLIGRELFEQMDLHVPYAAIGRTDQEPVYAPIPTAGHEGGEFFFKPATLAMKQNINPIPYAWLHAEPPVWAETIAGY